MLSENMDNEEMNIDEQEGGLFGFGSKKTNDLPALTQEVKENTNIKVRRAPLVSLPKNPLANGVSTMFPVRASRDLTQEQLTSEAVFKPIPNQDFKRANTISFTDKFLKQFIPKLLLVNMPQDKTKITALDLEKVTLLRKLCEISLFATKACAREIFNTVGDSNLISLENYDGLIETTNKILDTHFDDKFFSQAINTNITNNMRSIAKYPKNFMEFVLQLFVIYYYPKLLLEIIRNKMTNSARVIKEAKERLTDDTIDKFSKLVNNISNDELVGGVMEFVRLPVIPDTTRADEQIAAQISLDEAHRVQSKTQERLQREREDLQAFVNPEINNQDLLQKYIVDYNGSNSYVTNSRKVFYNALINFAVSINIDSSDYYKPKIILTLQSKFKQVLDVKTNDDEVDTTVFESSLTRYETEYDNARREFELLPELWNKYNELKTRLTRMRINYDKFIQDNQDNQGNPVMPETIDEKVAAITGIEIRMKEFTDTHLKSNTKESRTIQRYLLSEQQFDAAKNATQFLKTINKAKRDINTIDNIRNIITNIWLRNEITNDYIKNVQNNITDGIKESNMFYFTYVNAMQQPMTYTPNYTSQQQAVTPNDDDDMSVGGGKHRTRRHKKRAGTRRHKKRSGTHRKRKNTTK